MSALSSQLALLQYGDSFFPSGAVSFSWGLEGLAERGTIRNAADFESFVTGQLHARWANYDRAVVAAAHAAADDFRAMAEVDSTVELTTLAAELRSASRRAGAALLLVFARLGHESAEHFRALVAGEAAHGHLSAMQGMLWASAGLDAEAADALSAHSLCTGLVSAGIRLGCITHIEAQRILTAARREAALIARSPAPALNAISMHAPEAEIAAIHHALRDLRLFAN